MANTIQIKRKTTTGAPSTAQLAIGELCYNTVDHTLSVKRDASNVDTFQLPADILASPALTGTPTAPSPVADDSSTRIATTAWVQGEIAGGGGGDMMAATYDPNTVAGDAFDMDNMVEGTTTKILTDSERTTISNAIVSTLSDLTGVSWFIDEDTMSSNLATKVPSQQSVKAYVDTAINALVSAAPGTLDTLNELAAALGDDPNFSATMTSSLASKLDSDSTIDGGTIS